MIGHPKDPLTGLTTQHNTIQDNILYCILTWYIAMCYRPTYTPYSYCADVQPAGRYDDGVYASPPRQLQPAAPASDWMYGCPQSRTFKILESVMHNEGSFPNSWVFYSAYSSFNKSLFIIEIVVIIVIVMISLCAAENDAEQFFTCKLGGHPLGQIARSLQTFCPNGLIRYFICRLQIFHHRRHEHGW